MKPEQLLHSDVADGSSSVLVGSEHYLTLLEDSQIDYLQALSAAQRTLGNSSLAGFAATQARHARQFLDAQRAIMRLRVDAISRVNGIESTTEVEIAAMLDQAGVTADAPERRPGRRERVGASDAITSERQLRSLLDQWWRTERFERRALVEEAEARSSMRLHLARLRASAQRTAGDGAGPETDLSLLPQGLANVLEGADGTSLDSLIGTLLGMLDGVEPGADDRTADGTLGSGVASIVPPKNAVLAVDAVPPEPAADVPPPALDPLDVAIAQPALSAGTATEPIQVLPPTVPDEGLRIRSVDEFDRFWEGGQPWNGRRSSYRLVSQAIAPMAAFVAVLALILAAIG